MGLEASSVASYILVPEVSLLHVNTQLLKDCSIQSNNKTVSLKNLSITLRELINKRKDFCFEIDCKEFFRLHSGICITGIEIN
jgi:hypothetical protein